MVCMCVCVCVLLLCAVKERESLEENEFTHTYIHTYVRQSAQECVNSENVIFASKAAVRFTYFTILICFCFFCLFSKLSTNICNIMEKQLQSVHTRQPPNISSPTHTLRCLSVSCACVCMCVSSNIIANANIKCFCKISKSQALKCTQLAAEDLHSSVTLLQSKC